ncbi:MAG: hypothetical protein QOE30_5499, partial [Mycobacterium sp.]|uniref:LpqN/LpqT family lipoprotein n=1 Tax=Mycobacterium sp. TaxID=1785 RepID=UPI0028BA1383
MPFPVKAGGTAIAVVALSLTLAGCGSDTKSAPSSSSSSSSSSSESSSSKSSAPSTPAQAGKNETIADYIKEGGITETPVKRGEAGTPALDLPIPAGWEDAGAKTPPYAYAAIVSTDPT